VGVVAVAAGGAARTADDISLACGACHMPGSWCAPKLATRLPGKRVPMQSEGLDGILATAIAGINAMPAKSTAYTDDELRGAIRRCRACKPTLLMKKPPSGGFCIMSRQLAPLSWRSKRHRLKPVRRAKCQVCSIEHSDHVLHADDGPIHLGFRWSG
jgi:cytochrome c5